MGLTSKGKSNAKGNAAMGKGAKAKPKPKAKATGKAKPKAQAVAATAKAAAQPPSSFQAHCANLECATADLGTHATVAFAMAAVEAHAIESPGHLTVIGTNRWDAKCFTHPQNLALGTSAGFAMGEANKHLDLFPEHDVRVWET